MTSIICESFHFGCINSLYGVDDSAAFDPTSDAATAAVLLTSSSAFSAWTLKMANESRFDKTFLDFVSRCPNFAFMTQLQLQGNDITDELVEATVARLLYLTVLSLSRSDNITDKLADTVLTSPQFMHGEMFLVEECPKFTHQALLTVLRSKTCNEDVKRSALYHIHRDAGEMRMAGNVDIKELVQTIMRECLAKRDVRKVEFHSVAIHAISVLVARDMEMDDDHVTVDVIGPFALELQRWCLRSEFQDVRFAAIQAVDNIIENRFGTPIFDFIEQRTSIIKILIGELLNPQIETSDENIRAAAYALIRPLGEGMNAGAAGRRFVKFLAVEYRLLDAFLDALKWSQSLKTRSAILNDIAILIDVNPELRLRDQVAETVVTALLQDAQAFSNAPEDSPIRAELAAEADDPRELAVMSILAFFDDKNDVTEETQQHPQNNNESNAGDGDDRQRGANRNNNNNQNNSDDDDDNDAASGNSSDGGGDRGDNDDDDDGEGPLLLPPEVLRRRHSVVRRLFVIPGVVDAFAEYLTRYAVDEQADNEFAARVDEREDDDVGLIAPETSTDFQVSVRLVDCLWKLLRLEMAVAALEVSEAAGPKRRQRSDGGGDNNNDNDIDDDSKGSNSYVLHDALLSNHSFRQAMKKLYELEVIWLGDMPAQICSRLEEFEEEKQGGGAGKQGSKKKTKRAK